MHSINPKIRLSSLLLGLVLGLAFAMPAYAADVVFDADTTVTVNGNDYVILVGSEATTVEVGTTTVTVTVPSGSTFTFQSLDRHVLKNSAGIAQTCTENDNRLMIDGPQTDVVITPGPDTLCTISADDSTSDNSGGSRSAGSIVNQFANLIAMGNYQQAWNLMEQWPNLFSDEDRRMLQEKLLAAPVEPFADRELLLQQVRELQLQVIELANRLILLLQERLEAMADTPV